MTDSPSAFPSTSGTTATATATASLGKEAGPGDPNSVVDGYHRAWTSGQIDAAMSHLSEDACCVAPDEQVRSKQGWRAYLTGFQPMLTGAPEHARMTSGDLVAIWYYPQTATTTTALASELFTVRDGRITDIRLTFDRLSYGPPNRQTP